MPRNTNCLLGIRCPECGNEGRFYISALVTANVTDEGAEARGDMEWDGGSAILCPQCERAGKVDDFSKPFFSEQDADRLLQLGDEFLDRWAEEALRGTGRDPDYEERIDEWKAIRPLLAAAPRMRDALQQIANDSEACTCSTRGWHGEGHDTQCPVRIAAHASNPN
jgi:hypothetical protein